MLARVATVPKRVPVSLDSGSHHYPNVSRYGQRRGQRPGPQTGVGLDQSGRQPPPGGGQHPRRINRNMENPIFTSTGGTSANLPRFTASSAVASRQSLVDGVVEGVQASAPGAVSQVQARSLQSSTSFSLGNYGSMWSRGGHGAGVPRRGNASSSRGKQPFQPGSNLPTIPGSPSVHQQSNSVAQPYLPNPDDYLGGAGVNLDGNNLPQNGPEQEDPEIAQAVQLSAHQDTMRQLAAKYNQLVAESALHNNLIVDPSKLLPV